MADNTARFRAVLDDQVSSKLDRLRDKFDQVGGKGSAASFFGNVGAKSFAKGLDLIGDAAGSAIDFVQGSITAASDLNETVSKGRVIFGENADEIEGWAATAADSFGQSKRSAIDAASTFAGLFDTAGIALGEATDMSTKLTELGSDLASFFNTDVDEALQAVRSGLSGEAEPLRKFNVFLSETAVNAKLIELGQEKVNGQWTEGQKILGRYQILLEQTNDAQGDFDRTADGLANSQKTLNAQLEDQSAILGQKFLPIALQVTKWQIDFIEGLEAVGEFFDADAESALAYEQALREINARHVDGTGGFQTVLGLQQEILAAWRDAAAAGKVYGQTVVTTADDTRESAAIMAGSVRAVGDETVEMADDSIDKLGEFEDAWGDLRSALVGSAGDFADSIWDPVILKTEIAANELEQKQLRMVRDNAAAGEQERRDAALRIEELQKHRIEQLAELASYGDQSAKSALENELRILETTRELSDEQKAKLAQLRAALGLVEHAWLDVYSAANKVRSINPFQWQAKFGGGARAEGGPVAADTAYIVGEKGPELFVPDSSGTILPHAQPSGSMRLPGGGWGGGGGGPMTLVIPLIVNGREFARATIDDLDEEQYWRLAAAGGATVEG